MDIRKVKKLIELLEASGVAEIEIHEGEESVRISRSSTAAAAAAPSQTMTTVPQVAPDNQTSENIKSHLTPEDSVANDNYAEQGHVVTSPMVGIFYAAPAPEEPVFVTRGQAVKTGQILCVIEAMKIMNQIESEVSGKLLRVLVENGEAVEYGQPLFIIDPA